jgi:hypothetical protein
VFFDLTGTYRGIRKPLCVAKRAAASSLSVARAANEPKTSSGMKSAADLTTSTNKLGFHRDEIRVVREYRAMKPMQPLQLSPVITFGFVGVLALSAGAWWKDRIRLVHEIERMHWQMSYPVHPKSQPQEFNEEEQLVSYATQQARYPQS